jgi:general secretion pathway protein N
MTRRAWLYVATGCLVYLAALIATTPAPWVSRFVERFSHQALLLREPVGTAWAGSGRLYAQQRAGDLVDLGLLRWNTLLSGILTGKLGAEVALGESASAMRLDLSPASTAIRALNVELPGRLLSIVAPGLEALGPQGKVRIRSDNLRFDANSILGLADLEWRPVQLDRAHGLALGSHVARLRGGGSKVDIELGTIDGPLRLSGSGTWTAETGLDISGALEHGEDRSGETASFLQGVCSEYRAGRCAFRFKR